MEDREILDCIQALAAQERRLRDRCARGEAWEQHGLTEVEENLRQMWDLLRRRRALRAAGASPDAIDLRPSAQASAYAP